jgi:uncharacterized protein (DUF2225 family)
MKFKFRTFHVSAVTIITKMLQIFIRKQRKLNLVAMFRHSVFCYLSPCRHSAFCSDETKIHIHYIHTTNQQLYFIKRLQQYILLPVLYFSPLLQQIVVNRFASFAILHVYYVRSRSRRATIFYLLPAGYIAFI